MRTIFIHWHGPFSMKEVKDGSCRSGEFTQALLGNGLYAVTGKLKRQRYARLQYIGITQNNYTVRWDAKHVVHAITREQKLWLGSVAYEQTTRDVLEFAESMLIFFNDEAELNKMKKAHPPDHDCTLISIFFKKTTDEMYLRLPLIVRFLPEILIWHRDTKILRHKCRLNYFDFH